MIHRPHVEMTLGRFMDNRYPHFVGITQCSALQRDDRKRLSALASRVHRRTGCNATINMMTSEIRFHRGADIEIGIWSLPLYRQDGTVKRYEDHEVEDSIWAIQLAKVPKETKDKWAAEREQERLSEKEFARQSAHEDMRGELENRVEYGRERRGMSRGWRKSAVVNR